MGDDADNTAMIDLFLTFMSGQSLSEFTIRRRRSSLKSFAAWIRPMCLTHVDGVTVEGWVALYVAPRTKHAYRSDLSAFYRWATRRKLVERNPVSDTDRIRVPKSLPRPVPVEAVRYIVNSAPEPLRTGLALAAFAGLRRSEVVNLSTGDVSLFSKPPELMVRNGKGSKDRQVPVHPELALLLGRRRAQGFYVPMTADGLGRLAAAHIRRCGFDCTIHQLRSTFATELARLTGNVLLVGKLLGHESIATTMGYIGIAGYPGADQVGNMYGDDAA